MHSARMKKGIGTTTAIALCIVGVQIWLPASYYLGDEVYDERFAWRMFSAVRMTRCDFNLFDASSDTLQRIPLNKSNHVVWSNLAKRGRLSVIQGLVDTACRTRTDVRAGLSCTVPDAPTIGLCRNRTDGDGDGIPDGYNRMVGCEAGSPGACCENDCPEGDIERCYHTQCRTELLTTDKNRCQVGVES